MFETGPALRPNSEAGFCVVSVLRALYQDRPAAITSSIGNTYCPTVARPLIMDGRRKSIAFPGTMDVAKG